MTKRADFAKLIALSRAEAWLEAGETIATEVLPQAVAEPELLAVRSPVAQRPRRVVPWRVAVQQEESAGEVLPAPDVAGRELPSFRRMARDTRSWERERASDDPEGVELDLEHVELITEGRAQGVYRGDASGEEIIVRLIFPARPVVRTGVALPAMPDRSMPERLVSLFAQSTEAEWEEWQEATPALKRARVVGKETPVAAKKELSTAMEEELELLLSMREPAAESAQVVPLPAEMTLEARPERVIVPVEKLFSGLSNALGDVMDSVVGRRKR
ncbi:MAG: hypothetical protein H7836_05775 [Magnetococcus sp. YQC-3]